jgi:hypothetical protein
MDTFECIREESAPIISLLPVLNMFKDCDNGNLSMSEMQKKQLIKVNISQDLIVRVVKIVGLYSTKSAYQTNRSLNEKGLLRDPKNRKPWFINNDYKKSLQVLLDKHKGKNKHDSKRINRTRFVHKNEDCKGIRFLYDLVDAQ